MLTAIITVFKLSTSFRCTKRQGECLGGGYTLNMKATFSPEMDSINLGDTVFFSMSHPTAFFDSTKNQQVDYSGAVNLTTTISVLELIPFNPDQPKAAVNDFEFIPIEGVVFDGLVPAKTKEITFLEKTSYYQLKVAMRAKKKGIYFFGTSDIANVYRKNSVNCTDWASFVVRLDNANQHLYFYQDNRPGYTISQYEKDHAYCFKVK